MRWGREALPEIREVLGQALFDRGIRTGRYSIEMDTNVDRVRVTVLHKGGVFTEEIDAAELVIDRGGVEAKVLEFVDRIAGRDPHDVAYLPEGVG